MVSTCRDEDGELPLRRWPIRWSCSIAAYRALAMATLVSALAACSSGSQALVPDLDAGRRDASSSSSSILDGGADHPADGHHAPDHVAPRADAGHDAPTQTPDGGADGAAKDSTPPTDARTDSRVRKDAEMDSPTRTDAADAPPPGTDAHVDVYVPTVDASACLNGMGTIAIVGGSSHRAFGAASVDGAPWRFTTFAFQTVGSTPAVVPFGAGFLAVYSNTSSFDLKGSLWSAGPSSWSTPVSIASSGGGPSQELGSPGLAVLGDAGQLVYQGTTKEFYQGIYSGNAWGVADIPVGGAAMQDVGPSPPSAASAGGVLYAAYDGTAGGLYVDSYSATSWTGSQPVSGADPGAVTPTMTALTGGTYDAMIAYSEETTTLLESTVHTPGGGWSTPVAVHSAAASASSVALAPLAGGNAVMVYVGLDGRPYGSTYDATGSSWSVPVSVYPNSAPVLSTPSVAPGVCGVDAIVALAEPEGVVLITLTGSSFSPPVLLQGTASVTYAAVATTSAIAQPLADAAVDGDAKANDGGNDATMMMSTDAGRDASMEVDATGAATAFTCPSGQGTVALVGGSSIDAFGATSRNGGAWRLQQLGAETVGAVPAVVPYKTGFLSLLSTSLSDYIESTLYTGSWSDPVMLSSTGNGVANIQGAPSLAVLGANAELVYQGFDSYLYHAGYSMGAWDAASDPVGDSMSSHDESPTQPAAAAVNGVLYAAYYGGRGQMYVDTWTSAGGWENQVILCANCGADVPPTMIPLTPTTDGGASSDLMLVFEFPTTNSLYSSVHRPGGGAGTWVDIVPVNASATTENQVALAALPGGNAEMVYLGEDGLAYASTYTASTTSWSAPDAVDVAGGTLESPPSVATGVCGFDAVAALVETGGVKLATLESGAWSTPVAVAGLSPITFAAVATAP